MGEADELAQRTVWTQFEEDISNAPEAVPQWRQPHLTVDFSHATRLEYRSFVVPSTQSSWDAGELPGR